MNVLRETIQHNHSLTFCVRIVSLVCSVKSRESIDQVLAVDSILNSFPSYMLPNCIISGNFSKHWTHAKTFSIQKKMTLKEYFQFRIPFSTIERVLFVFGRVELSSSMMS